MENKDEIEILDFEDDKKEEKPIQNNSKNSVVLMFGVLGGLVFMILIIASIFFLIPFLNGTSSSTKKGTDAQKVYSTYRMSSNSLENFDLAFLKMENNGKNRVYSPLSIKYALAMLSEGSKGTTKNQITAIIGDYKSHKYSNSDHMSFANAMYIRNTFNEAINEKYKSNLKEKYNAEVLLDDFTSAANMNKWVSDKTFNMINNLLDDDAVKQEDFELINALAIDMNWNNQIQCASGRDIPCIRYDVNYRHEKIENQDYEYNDHVMEINSDRDYHSLKFNGKENIKSVEVKAAFNRYDVVTLIGKDKIKEEVGKAYKEWLATDEAKNTSEEYFPRDVDTYLEKYIKELGQNYGRENYSTDFMIYTDDNVKAFAKDLETYDNTTLQYIGIMPKKVELNKYIDDLSAEDVNNIINGLKDMKGENFTDGVLTLVYGYIPLFDYEDSLDLEKDLKKLGVKDVFDVNKADLSGMLSKNNNEYISSASHKAKIEFSNDGIRAAAATQLGGAGATGAGFNYLYEVPVEKIDITFDKPYMYLIRDKSTGEVWFAGSVYEPKTK